MKLIQKIKNFIKNIFRFDNFKSQEKIINQLGNLQKLIIENSINSKNILDYEFKVFSQWGEDGIVNYLINHIKIKNNYFVEFGVENYTESNTRFLLTNRNWSGLVLDSSKSNIDYIKNDPIYWKYNMKALNSFITKENINNILNKNLIKKEVGLLSIDIDGNDYWIWESINIDASIVIIEYNSRFGSTKSVTVPYNPNFQRAKAHYSNIYYGASIAALTKLANKKGYSLVCCNSNGNNAFFVKKNLLNETVSEKKIDECFVRSKFREGRDKNGKLTFLTPQEEEDILLNLPLEEV